MLRGTKRQKASERHQKVAPAGLGRRALMDVDLWRTSEAHAALFGPLAALRRPGANLARARIRRARRAQCVEPATCASMASACSRSRSQNATMGSVAMPLLITASRTGRPLATRRLCPRGHQDRAIAGLARQHLAVSGCARYAAGGGGGGFGGLGSIGQPISGYGRPGGVRPDHPTPSGHPPVTQ
jgi:hypothetical protein